MPCPFFEPLKTVQPAQGRTIRLPLLGEYVGLCHASTEASAAPEEMLLRCNLGYSSGVCNRYPAGERRSCLRYHLNGRTASFLRVLCIEEENFAPLRWYEVSCSVAEGRLEPEIEDACIRAQIFAFCRGYLERFAAAS